MNKFALLAPMAALSAGLSQAQTTGELIYTVLNRSGATVTCKVKASQGQWSQPFTLKSGEDWRADGTVPVFTLFCREPVRQVIYRLSVGRRYTLLRPSPAGPVRLVEVTANLSEGR